MNWMNWITDRSVQFFDTTQFIQFIQLTYLVQLIKDFAEVILGEGGIAPWTSR